MREGEKEYNNNWICGDKGINHKSGDCIMQMRLVIADKRLDSIESPHAFCCASGRQNVFTRRDGLSRWLKERGHYLASPFFCSGRRAAPDEDEVSPFEVGKLNCH